MFFQFGELNITNSDEIHMIVPWQELTLEVTSILSSSWGHELLGWSTVFQKEVMLMEPKRAGKKNEN